MGMCGNDKEVSSRCYYQSKDVGEIQLIAGYKVIKQIGKGAYGSV